MKTAFVFLLIASGTLINANAQSVTNGRATSSGGCSVSHSGNGDVITIKNCGVGAAELRKIADLLKAALADSQSMDLKLDELLRVASRPSIAIQAPVTQSGGDCTQNIVGGSNNSNNCAPKAVSVSQEQAKAITGILKGFTGLAQKKMVIAYEISAIGAPQAAANLEAALEAAGITVEMKGGSMFYDGLCPVPSYPGLSLDCVNDKDPFDQAIAVALVNSGVVTKPIYATVAWSPDNSLGIIIRKP